ncbi:MAG: hypothetical protein AB7Q29_15540 [Vicinamibacterales bacterium]
MERLRQKDVDAGIVARPLSEASKTAIADLRRFYQAKVAEQEVLHQSHMKGVTDAAEREALHAEWLRERQRLTDECERKIEKIRQTGSSAPG